MTTTKTAKEEAIRATVVDVIMDEPINVMLNGLLAQGFTRQACIEIVKTAQERAGLEAA